MHSEKKLHTNDHQSKEVNHAQIDTRPIEENWDDILQLIVTIKLKEVAASELYRRLDSYSNQHPLYRALKAFGKIIKSILSYQN